MADQFDKKTILSKMQEKASAKGFELNPDRGDMSKDVVTLDDLLDAMAESLAEIISKDQDLTGTIRASSIKLGPAGEQKPVAYKDGLVKADATTDPSFFSWIEALHSVIQGSYPEPGNGSPNVFATALKTILSLKPTSITAKIVDGSSKVKITI